MAEVVRAPRDDGDNMPNMAMTEKQHKTNAFVGSSYERNVDGTYKLLSMP